MAFGSPLFLFAFLPIFLAFHAAVPRRASNAFLLGVSLLFYAWGEPRFVFVVIASAIVDFLLVKRIDADRENRRAAVWLSIGVAANLALLAWFKYAGFAWESLRSLSEEALGLRLGPIGAVALPLGVSFVVFEKITYLVDVKRGLGRPARSLLDYLLYVFLFPKLLAGPIVKYHDLEAELRERSAGWDDLAVGLRRFSIGLAKKVLVADAAGELVDVVFAPGPEVGFAWAWIGPLAFSVQVYFDFSGYSDMAIGLARTMGFRLKENFDRPYLAVGFGAFWRRWHISLSTWIRDYLYVPLGGDRVSPARTYANLWICFLASGLWHGAAWTFVVWGTFHGTILVLERLGLRRALERLPRPLGVAVMFLFLNLGWVLFRAPDLELALARYGAMLDPGRASERVVLVTGDVWLAIAVGLVVCFHPLVPPLGAWTERVRAWPSWPPVAATAALALTAISTAKAMTVAFHPFLYFRF